MIFGVINRIVLIACPFINRTVLQRVLGEEYLGLDSVFVSILRVLSLSELGLGAAIVYSMYKPVAENDTPMVEALLAFYKKVYRLIGLAILLIGTAILPLLPFLIKEEIPGDVSLPVLYMVVLIDTSLSYFLYAYLSSLIIVYQRDDYSSKISIVISVLMTASQVIVLVLSRNYLYTILVKLVFTVLSNLLTAAVVKKKLPSYRCRGSVPKEMLKDIAEKVSGSVVVKVSKVSRNAIDSLCITAFISLAMTAKYNNYYVIMNGVITILTVVSAAFKGGVGNHTVTLSREKNYSELKKLDFVYMLITGWCACFLLCLSQPFMELWMGKKMLLPEGFVYLLVTYFYILAIGDMRSIYSEVLGHWYHQRWRAVIESVANVFLNVVLGRLWGVYGIMLATIISMFVFHIIWSSRITFREFFGMEHMKDYYLYHLLYAAVSAGVVVICYMLSGMLSEYPALLRLGASAGICLIVPLVWYLLVYGRTERFREMMAFIRH